MKNLDAAIFEIAIRKNATDTILPFDGSSLTGFRIIKVPLGKWGADPFLYENGGNCYLFAELFDLFTGKGALYCMQINIARPKWRKCSVDSCHLSFPNVYSCGGAHVMIPETSELDFVSSYTCRSFPLLWERTETMVSGCKAVDSVLLIDNDSTYLFSYCIDKTPASLRIYQKKQGNFLLYQVMVDIEKTLRPAGKVFAYGGDYYLPTQDCRNGYGEGVFINRISFIEGHFALIRISQIDFHRIISDSALSKKIVGMHTYNFADGYEVIDLKKSKFSFLRIIGKPFRVLFRTRKK